MSAEPNASTFPALNAAETEIEVSGERFRIVHYSSTLGIEYFAIVRSSQADRAFIVTRDGAIHYTRAENPRAVQVADVVERSQLIAALARIGFVVPFHPENADTLRDLSHWVRHFNHTPNGAARLNPPPANGG